MVKKGFIFSIISILIVLCLSIIFSVLVTEYSQNQNSDVKFKSEAVNRYYTNVVDYYLPIILEHSSKTALKSMINYSVSKHIFIPSGEFENIHSQLLKTGNFTYNSGLDQDLMHNNTLEEWLYLLSFNKNGYISSNTFTGNIFSKNDSFDIEANYSRIHLFQESPFEVTVQAFFKINFTSDEFQIIDDNLEIKRTYSLLNLTDPLYAYYSNGSLILPFLNSTEIINNWDYYKLKEAIPKNRFYNSPNAPSFLMRLQGDFNDSIYGVESFIHPYWYLIEKNNYLYNYTNSFPGGIDVNANRLSHIDYLFFQGNLDCVGASDSKDFHYNFTGISDYSSNPDINMTYFNLDFNNSVKYLGSDFSSYSSISCP